MFCPQCGAPNEDDAVFCGNCGAVLNPDELSAEAEVEMPEGATVDEDIEVAVYQVSEESPEADATELVPVSDDLPAEPPLPPPPPPAPPPPRAPATQTSGIAIASLVMGIAGWTIIPVIGSILAIVFGYAARKEIRQRPDELSGEGMAVAGLVLGWIMVGISVLALCLGSIGLCFFLGLVGTSGY
jgi:uncharacterized Zn finger protein (UPF0148 family)